MPKLEIPFGKYRPDTAPFSADVTDLENLIYYDGKYWAFAEPVVYSSAAVSDDPLRLFAVEDTAGNFETFLGSDTKLYRLGSGPIFEDMSQVGGYSVNTGETWDYTMYGNSLVCVGGSNVAPQHLADIAGLDFFADLGGTPPAAKCCTMFKDHLFLGNCTTGVTASPLRVYRSAQGNIEDWTPDTASGCGYKDLAAWGQEIVAMVPIGDRLAVYCTDSVWFVDFVGSPYWFSYEQVYQGPGPMSVGSVVPIDVNTHLFLAETDAYMLTSGGGVNSIGLGIRRTIIEPANTDTYRHRIQGVLDNRLKTVAWIIPSDQDYCTSLLTCNYEEQAWGIVSVNAYAMGPIAGTAVLVGDVTDPVSAFSGITLGSSYWRTGGAIYGIIDDNKYLSRFAGAAMTGTIETGEQDFGRSISIRSVVPLIGSPDGGCVVTVSHRPTPYSAVSTHTATYSASVQKACVRVTDRSMKVKLVITGSHQGVRGVSVDYIERGVR